MSRHQLFTEFKNIRTTPDGYQVVITRAKIETSKLYAGHSAKSLKAAQRHRDRLLKQLPSKRKNPVPPRIFRACGLSAPVVGVFRHPTKPQYQVAYTDEEGRKRSRAFSWSHRDGEASAYAEAVTFRQAMVRAHRIMKEHR